MFQIYGCRYFTSLTWYTVFCTNSVNLYFVFFLGFLFTLIYTLQSFIKAAFCFKTKKSVQSFHQTLSFTQFSGKEKFASECLFLYIASLLSLRDGWSKEPIQSSLSWIQTWFKFVANFYRYSSWCSLAGSWDRWWGGELVPIPKYPLQN